MHVATQTVGAAKSSSIAGANPPDTMRRIKSVFGGYCVSIVYVGPVWKKQETTRAASGQPLPLTPRAREYLPPSIVSSSIFNSPWVGSFVEFDFHSDNHDSSATVFMLPSNLPTVRFFTTLVVPLISVTIPCNMHAAMQLYTLKSAILYFFVQINGGVKILSCPQLLATYG